MGDGCGWGAVGRLKQTLKHKEQCIKRILFVKRMLMSCH